MEKKQRVCPTCGANLGQKERNAAIVKARRRGVTLDALAQQYGLSKNRIFIICKRAEERGDV